MFNSSNYVRLALAKVIPLLSRKGTPAIKSHLCMLNKSAQQQKTTSPLFLPAPFLPNWMLPSSLLIIKRAMFVRLRTD